MKLMNVFLGAAIAVLSTTAGADTVQPKNADNTGVNVRDKKSDTLTPSDQSSGSEFDVELTRRIRELVNKDKSLSSDAHNVKIITLKGVATLRGPVDSAAERAKVEKIARQVTGVASVRNELDVKTTTN